MRERGVVIIGGGESGARAALALREHGRHGPITLIGEESLAPYERPPLSKSALTDEADPAPVTVGEAGRFRHLGVETVFDVRVEAIDRKQAKVTTRTHGEFGYDRLILATGAASRGLSCEGGDLALTLRTFNDAITLRRKLRACSRLIVIGGGFIGLEVAASARKVGVAVCVIEAAGRVLARAVPEDIAQRLAARHVEEGVNLRVGCSIVRIGRDGEQYVVELAGGEKLIADLVVAGVGSTPRTELAAAADLEIDNGVVVNSALQTHDPAIFALGDCCSFPHPLFKGKRIRLEAWRNAQDQADFLARSLGGEEGEYAAVPWFWSDQYDLHLQIVGLPSEGARIVRRELGDGALLDFHLDEEGRLVGASALGVLEKVARDARIAEKLIASRATPDPDLLAKPSYKLRALLAA